MPHSPVSKVQRGRAKQLRQTMTHTERLLWRYLKAGHLDGLSFRRQSPMGPYIVDFVSHATKVVVEVDGESHDFASQLERDRIRDAWLAARGYAVLRFSNGDVLRNLEGVLLAIRDTAIDRARELPPSLALPRKGGGNPHEPASAQSPAASLDRSTESSS
jgi:very-short-patch-repair endonuclease